MALILQDSLGGLWSVTIDDNGGLGTTSVLSGLPSAPVLNDAGGSTSWIVGVTSTGQLKTTTTTFIPGNPTFITLTSPSATWKVGVTVDGLFTTNQQVVTVSVLGSGKVTAVNPISSFTIPVRTVFTLTWTLTDAAGIPINNATVTATLFAGRSATNPLGTPGTPVSPINGLTLGYVAGSAGQYSAVIPGEINPPLNGTGYTLVVDATVAATQIYHTEQPATVETAGSLLDLTTVDQVKSWIPGLAAAGSADDAIIQACITAWGFEFLNRTGLGNQNGDLLQSPFCGVCNFSETYDGTGTYRLFVRNRPVKNVSALIINGIQVAQSSGFSVQGWVIDGTGKSISLRPGLLGWGGSFPQTAWQSGAYRAFGGGMRFFEGIQNIYLQYSAGYNNTPADVVQCANKVVAQNYRRRSWVDEASRAMSGGAGTIRYRDWDLPSECQYVVDRYTRTL